MYPTWGIHWLPFGLGLTTANQWPYLLWSGIIGDLALFAAIAAAWWHHTCHEEKCPRWARYVVNVEGGTVRVCRRHFKHVTGHHNLSADLLRDLHLRHLASLVQGTEA